MTPDEAIAKWRGIKSLEDLDHEFKSDPEFYTAFQEAGRLAQASGDPSRNSGKQTLLVGRKNNTM